MSNIYIQEPPTNGKVLLSTTVGDIDIELWSKECPKACRNFVQLCMEGYYENTIFHRVIPEFIIQGGDPTGTGTGGESIYGKPFRDEFHTRLRFVRRGLVAMANAGANDNASQFFFTLGATPELNNKHTIFGKVAGDTIYNMLKLVEVEVGPDDRPLFPHKINKAKILSNPFDDIVPRRLPNRKKSEDEESSKKKKSQSKATKNFSLLSFGEEAEQEEDVVKKVNKSMKSKSKSSHDLLDDSKLSAVPAVETKDLTRLKRKQEREQEGDEHKKEDMTDSSEEEDNKEATKERIRKKLKREKHDDVQKTVAQKESIEEEPDDVALAKSKTLEELKKEARRLKRELRAAKAKEDNEKLEPKIEPEPTPTIETESALDALQGFKADRQKYKEKQKAQPKKGASREAQTMALLAKFQSKLSTAKQMAQDYGDEEEEEEERPPTPVQLTEDGEEIHEEVDDGSDLSWMSHKLKFEANKRKVIDANINDEDRYEIFDPRNPLNKRRREASKQAMKGKR